MEAANEISQISHKKRLFLELLAKHYGNVSKAADASNGLIVRRTHYEWMEHDPEYAKAYEECRERLVDLGEESLRRLVEGVVIQKDSPDGAVIYQEPPNPQSVIFLLKTQGKKRGYIERSELGITGMKPTDIIDIRFGDKTTPSRQSTESTGAAEAV